MFSKIPQIVNAGMLVLTLFMISSII